MELKIKKLKNNPNKFPERYAWTLTKDEAFLCSRSKFSTLNENKIKRGQNLKYLPRVFTGQGVAMLATILKSNVATKVSIAIIDVFVLKTLLDRVYKIINI